MHHRRLLPAAAVLVLAISLLLVESERSASAQAQSLTFAAAGDFAAKTNTGGVLTAIRGSGSALTLALGDLSYGDDRRGAGMVRLRDRRVGAGFPFELLAGNHESNGQNGNINDFSACLPNQLPGLVGTYGRQWYVDVPAGAPLVRFVMISPELPFPDGTGLRRRHRRATSGRPRRSTAPVPRASRGSSSACTSRACRSGSTPASRAPTS